MMKFSRAVLLFVSVLVATGCGRGSGTSSGVDFEAIQTALEAEVGDSFQAMQMQGMTSVTFRYDGAVQTVIDIVEPMATASGFRTIAKGGAGGEVGAFEQATFKHPDGDVLAVTTMDVSTDGNDMKRVVIQLMDSDQMEGLAESMKQ